jgi:tight adherence protein B
MELIYLTSGLFALSVFLIFFGWDRSMRGQSNVIESRLDRYAARQVATPSQPAAPSESLTGLNRLVAQGASAQIQTELARADVKLTTSEFVLLNIGTVLIGFLVGLLLFRGNVLLALAGGVVGFYAPRFYLRRLQNNRLAAFNSQLGDTIILLANSLRSGYSLLQSMETVSRELPPPMSTEFARVTREVGLGLSLEAALANLLRRINSDDLDLMITAINVQHEVGGNLAEILDTIAHTIRERVRIQGEIKSITAMQSMSGNVLALLPVALGLAMYAMNPRYISLLWQEQCGWFMLGAGGLGIVLGYFAIKRIVAIEV